MRFDGHLSVKLILYTFKNMTKQCAKCQKSTNGVKVDKGTWLCWECFQEFYSQYQPINIKEAKSQYKKAIKKFLK